MLRPSVFTEFQLMRATESDHIKFHSPLEFVSQMGGTLDGTSNSNIKAMG